MDITAWNNEGFTAAFDVSAWSMLYTLETASWRLQARRAAASADLYLDIPTVGQASIAADVVTFVAPSEAMARLSGTYEWDFGFAAVGYDFVRCAGGTLTVEDGVTRRAAA